MHRTRNKLLNILRPARRLSLSLSMRIKSVFKYLKWLYETPFLGGVLYPTFIPKQIISTEFYAILNGNKNHIAQFRADDFHQTRGNRTRQDGGWNSVGPYWDL